MRTPNVRPRDGDCDVVIECVGLGCTCHSKVNNREGGSVTCDWMDRNEEY